MTVGYPWSFYVIDRAIFVVFDYGLYLDIVYLLAAPVGEERNHTGASVGFPLWTPTCGRQ